MWSIWNNSFFSFFHCFHCFHFLLVDYTFYKKKTFITGSGVSWWKYGDLSAVTPCLQRRQKESNYLKKRLKNYNFLLNEFNNSLLFFIEVAKEHHKIRALLWSSFFVGFYHSPMDHSLQTLYITIKSFFNRRQETLQQSLLSVFKRFPSNSISI